VTGLLEKALLYSKKLSTRCNLPAQIEQEQDKIFYTLVRVSSEKDNFQFC
jgi:hypothetical protein